MTDTVNLYDTKTSNDLFDRLIIAPAYLEGMVLCTRDRRMQPYGVVTVGLD